MPLSQQSSTEMGHLKPYEIYNYISKMAVELPLATFTTSHNINVVDQYCGHERHIHDRRKQERRIHKHRNGKMFRKGAAGMRAEGIRTQTSAQHACAINALVCGKQT